jgi:CRP-like cAMP-binding protein
MKCSDLIKSFDFYNVLSETEKEYIAVNTRQISYSKGAPIVKQGSFITDAIFICSGYVKIHAEFKRKPIIFKVLGSNKVALLGSMMCSELHPFNITAIDEVSVFLTDITVLRQIADSNNKFVNRLIEMLNTSMLKYIENNLISLTQNNIHGRLANTLLYLSEIVFQSKNFDMLLTRKELAQLCNISRENVIKVLYEFNNDGLIRLSGKKIQILSLENLRRVANNG